MEWITGKGGPSKWDSAQRDWETALEKAEGDKLVAIGILVALAVDTLEEVKQRVAEMENRPTG